MALKNDFLSVSAPLREKSISFMLNSYNFHSDGTRITTKGQLIMAITAKIEGSKLVITADLETPTPSASGKTLVVASTRGNKETDVVIDGKPVIIGLNAYIKK
jgi:hypothetical protein